MEKYALRVKLDTNKDIKVYIEKPELIYGATAILSEDKDIIGLTAINPITCENIPILGGGVNETRFFIPAHYQMDYDFAKKNNMNIKQAVAPYYIGTNNERVNPDVAIQERHSVIVVLKHCQNNKYLCENAKNRDCKSFILGGVEKNESVVEAALREIYEETGYTNIAVNWVSNFKLINYFYAEYRHINRFSYLTPVFCSLINEERDEISEEESMKHSLHWIQKEKLSHFINLPTNRYVLDMLITGEKAWTQGGIMITKDGNDKREDREARKNIIKRLDQQKILLFCE